MYRTILNLKKKLENLQRSLSKAERDRDYYKEQFEKEQTKNSELLEDATDLHRVRRALGPERIDGIIATERRRDAEIEAQRKAAELQHKQLRRKHDRDAR